MDKMGELIEAAQNVLLSDAGETPQGIFFAGVAYGALGARLSQEEIFKGIAAATAAAPLPAPPRKLEDLRASHPAYWQGPEYGVSTEPLDVIRRNSCFIDDGNPITKRFRALSNRLVSAEVVLQVVAHYLASHGAPKDSPLWELVGRALHEVST